VPLTRTAIANAGVDRDLFTPREPGEWKGRLAVVGRIDERKGIAIATRALAQLPAATLTVDGSGSPTHRAELEALAAELGVAKRITFAQGARSALPDVYAAADAVLFPVLWPEPWGLVPLEAMAVGRPVVATGTGGSAEYLRDGENCLIYAPREDPAALAAAIERLAGDPALRDRLRERGFETAARYDERNFAARIAELLDSVAGG
jgi:glycosyltransferase involved in cell wall biosynthesis